MSISGIQHKNVYVQSASEVPILSRLLRFRIANEKGNVADGTGKVSKPYNLY